MNAYTTYSGPACLAVNANATEKIDPTKPVPSHYEQDDADVLWTLFRK